jgi:uncharacterized membrane protein
MEDVEEVQQLSPHSLRWRAKVWGQEEQRDSEITEQIPDKRIAWRSDGGPSNAGVVTFHRLSDDRARVMLQMVYQPESSSEKIGDALGIFSRRIESDLDGFKTFVEKQGDEVDGWSGRIAAPDDSAQTELHGVDRESSDRFA